MVHSMDAGEVPLGVSIEMSRTTVEPGVPVPDDRPKLTFCAQQANDATSNAKTTRGTE